MPAAERSRPAQTRLHGHELIAERTLDASPARVWHALTTPSCLARFWGGERAEVVSGSVVADVRPGGAFALELRAPASATTRLEFVYRTVRAPHELVFDEPARGIETTVSLRPAAGGTHLTVHQRRLPAELRTHEAGQGLGSLLDALAALVETPADV